MVFIAVWKGRWSDDRSNSRSGRNSLPSKRLGFVALIYRAIRFIIATTYHLAVNHYSLVSIPIFHHKDSFDANLPGVFRSSAPGERMLRKEEITSGPSWMSTPNSTR